MKFDQSIDAQHQVPAHVQVTRKTPIGLAQAFLLPALALGAAGVVLVGAVLLVAGTLIGPPWGLPFIATGAACIMGLVYLVGGKQARDMLAEALWQVETVTGKDFTGDGAIGRPVVSVEVSDLSNRQWRFMELPGSPEALQQLAQGVLTGKTLAEAEWTGSGRPYTRNEFRDLRATLVERGIVTWRNPRHPAQGVELTKAGRAVFAELARTHARVGPGYQIEAPARGAGKWE